ATAGRGQGGTTVQEASRGGLGGRPRRALRQRLLVESESRGTGPAAVERVQSRPRRPDRRLRRLRRLRRSRRSAIRGRGRGRRPRRTPRCSFTVVVIRKRYGRPGRSGPGKRSTASPRETSRRAGSPFPRLLRPACSAVAIGAVG